MDRKHILYYIHDPMCSWCYGFSAVWQRLQQQLPESVEFKLIVGGLAADTEDPMPQPLREKLQQTWQEVNKRTGVSFNYDFWSNNIPIRSTYPACRAVLCASFQNKKYESLMIQQIQSAYYQQAKNPALSKILEQCAEAINLDSERFCNDMQSTRLEEEFNRQLLFANSIGANSFPSLFFKNINTSRITSLPINYIDEKPILEALNKHLG